MPTEASQARVERLQSRDPLGDVGTPFVNQPRKLRGRVRTVTGVAPACDPSGILERNVEATEINEKSQVLDVRLAIVAVVVVST